MKKYKILWIVNILLPAASEILGFEKTNYGGWLSGYLDNLKNSNCEFYVICPSDIVKQIEKISNENITYFVVPKNKLTQDTFEEIIKNVSPNLIHIHGTEYPHSLEMARAAKKANIKAVVSIQGLMCECEKHYDAALPKKYLKNLMIKRIIKKGFNKINLYPQFILTEKEYFNYGAQIEAETLNLVEHVIGRSNWDKLHTNRINKKLSYYKVNENLRNEFYTTDSWNYNTCEKHSIFISQSNYPIKGFHILVEALNIVVKKYPETKVFIGGFEPPNLNNKILDTVIDMLFEYQTYVKNKIKKYGLKKNIMRLGNLDVDKMKQAYLNANVFISASSIENGSNSVSEAMMLKVPVITSEVGGVGSVFRYGVDGLSYEFADYETLAKHIETIFELKEKVNVYTDNAYEYAKKEKDVKSNIFDLLAAYNTIISN